jgi:hypothetical protein
MSNSPGQRSFVQQNDKLLVKLKEQDQFKRIQEEEEKRYRVEAEEDLGNTQQISGGFGDTTHLDEEAIKLLVKHQRDTEERVKAN